MEWLRGKKTYIVTILAGLVLAGYLLGWLDEKTTDALLVMLGFGGLAALRAGVRKVEDPPPPPRT
jgi:hypothetical protein